MINDTDIAQHGEETCVTAIHEAGHFVMAILINGSLPRSLSIKPSGYSLGRISGAGHFSTGLDFVSVTTNAQRAAVRMDVLMLIAGPVAESVEFGDNGDDGWTGDYQAMREYLAALGDDFDEVYWDYWRFAYKLMMYKRPRRAIRLIVDRLLEHGELDCSNGLYELYDDTIKVLGDYYKRAYAKIDKWTADRQ